MDIDSARVGAWVGQFVWPFLRLSAFLLFCIGVQVLWSGVSELLTLQAQSVP